MLSVQMWRIMTKIFNKQVDENELHASEALYHSLGYAMNSYIENLKSEKDNSAWKEAQEVNDFNVYVVINKMKLYRDKIDKDYLHIAKKRYVGLFLPTYRLLLLFVFLVVVPMLHIHAT